MVLPTRSSRASRDPSEYEERHRFSPFFSWLAAWTASAVPADITYAEGDATLRSSRPASMQDAQIGDVMNTGDTLQNGHGWAGGARPERRQDHDQPRAPSSRSWKGPPPTARPGPSFPWPLARSSTSTTRSAAPSRASARTGPLRAFEEPSSRCSPGADGSIAVRGGLGTGDSRSPKAKPCNSPPRRAWKFHSASRPETSFPSRATRSTTASGTTTSSQQCWLIPWLLLPISRLPWTSTSRRLRRTARDTTSSHRSSRRKGRSGDRSGRRTERTLPPRYEDEVVTPIALATAHSFLNMRYNALAALSLRRFVAGRLYVSLKAGSIAHQSDEGWVQFLSRYNALLDKFEASVVPHLVPVDI